MYIDCKVVNTKHGEMAYVGRQIELGEAKRSDSLRTFLTKRIKSECVEVKKRLGKK